jgi:ribokinase
MRNGEILLFGDINIDTVWPVSEFPTPGRDAYAKSVSVGIGGAVVNTAIVLDKLSQRTGLLACVGKDIWAEKAAETLNATGINQAYLKVKPDCTTGLIFLIVTPDGERTMYSCRGANVQYEAVDVDEEALKNAGLLHISGYALVESPQKDAVWRAVELAKKYNVPICLDTGLDPAIHNPTDLCRLLPELTICITGPKETAELFNISLPEEAAEHMLSLGVNLVAIKQGEKGSFVATQTGKFHCPAFHVNAVDTTGAGDSFTAGLIYGWSKGMSLPATAVMGSALGALAASVYGAGLALPGKQKALEFLKSEACRTARIPEETLEEVLSVLEADN